MTTSLRLLEFVASGLGSGRIPKAPGTWGSLVALFPAWLLIEYTGQIGLMIATVLVLVLGCLVSKKLLPELDQDDPGWIVIDEWVGLWVSILLIQPFQPELDYLLLWAFLAFRLFDIVKPYPIGRVEKWGPPWWSIMADDILAGIMAAVSVVVLAAVISNFT